MTPPAPPTAPEATRSDRRRGWLLLLAVLVASVLFRLPALLNAAGVHSDAAIVGLQAMHLLKGEWSWFIWGAGYQGWFDAGVVALFFAVMGATPLALMLAPLSGHLLLTGFTFDVLRKRVGAGSAAILTLALAFAPHAINTVALYAPRQWCFTFVFAGIWLLDGARESRAPVLRCALGALMCGLSLYLDLLSLQLMPALGVLALFCTFDGGPPAREWGRRAAGIAAGTAVALGVLWLSRLSPVANATKAALGLEFIRRNFDLLWNTCLPWLLGYGVYVPGPNLYPDLWRPPTAFHAVQLLGALVLAAGILFGGLALFARSVPWPVRRLGVFGLLSTGAALGGFLLSSMPADMWSVRYLASIVWTAPLALAPLAFWLRARVLFVVLAPYLVTAAAGGWMSFGPYVNGPSPVRTARGIAEEEQSVGRLLRERGVRYGAAHYWLSYRLTFLWKEETVLVPWEPSEDRYAPYRRGFEQAPVVAYVFHPSEPRAQPGPVEHGLKQAGQKYERLAVGGFTVILHHRER
ncbi:MAG TPA: hypothetical protein VK420_22610 [Longimicrobium sp.]|nr:hypothetical protein [Longimicrobium sp.]